MKSDTDCDVCVVGLGASGLTAIIELATAGFRVVGVDAVDVGAGAAGRNGGFLLAGDSDFYHDSVKKYGRDKALAIYKETMHELEITFREFPSCSKNVGSLRIAADENELECCRKQYNEMKADGLPVEWYEGPEGKGLLFPTDGVFNPLSRARLLAHKAIKLGASLYSQTPVSDV